jgi:thiosulfate/3-mercaptopyruvate sulfurtransferase
MNTLILPGPLVSTDWLANHLRHPNLIVLDASMKPPTQIDSAPDLSSTLQIPGSRIFDFDKKICDKNNSIPHMMPSPQVFEEEVQRLGVHKDSSIVIYDRIGMFSSPRAFWMFKAMGFEQVAVLDGGFPKWIAESNPIEALSDKAIVQGNFVAHPKQHSFCNADQVTAALNNKSQVVLDARSEGRFYGREPEPRPGLRPGHMPHAVNLPFSAVQKNGCMLPIEELKKIFLEKMGSKKRIVTSCGSGVTACVIALAAQLAGYSDIVVYDGSWCEWGLPSPRPVVQ